MQSTQETIVYIAIPALLSTAYILDIYSMMARTAVNKEKSSEVFAVANWINYQARILTMMAAFSLSFSLEHSIIGTDVRILFLISGTFSIILLCLLLFTTALSLPFKILQLITVARFFGELGKRNFRRAVVPGGGSTVLPFSFLVGFMILAATIVPFLFSQAYPQYRMTLVYIGQAFNFVASVVVFTTLDRHFYQSIDSGTEENNLCQQVGGRLLAQIVIILSIAASFLVL